MGEKTGEGKAGRGTRGAVDGEREGKTKAPKRKEQCPLDRILTPARALAEPPRPTSARTAGGPSVAGASI